MISAFYQINDTLGAVKLNFKTFLPSFFCLLFRQLGRFYGRRLFSDKRTLRNMPELPEAETIRKQIAAAALGKTIRSVRITEEKILRAPTGKSRFIRALKGRKICRVERRGKAVILILDDSSSLVVRLGMSGSLVVEPKASPFDKHTHLRLEVGDSLELRFRDPRKFGGLYLHADSDVNSFPEFAHFGPEPLSRDLNAAYLAKTLKGRTAKIGVLLMDQRIVAGLGKIYADEACFVAGIKPTRQAGGLRLEEVTALVKAIKSVLKKAIANRGTTAEDRGYIDARGYPGGFRPAVYQRTGRPCRRCKTPICRTAMSGNRGIHWCPKCQK
jgi:formamidopyrimidine-DNA glycosylase